MSKWIRKGDRVQVIAGNDKGKVGEVLSRSEDRVLVQGVNFRIKHTKPTQQSQVGRVEREFPIHISNVAPCTEAGETIRLRVREGKNGRELFYQAEGKEVLYRHVKEAKK